MATPLEKLTNAVFYFKINTTAMASSPNYFGGVLLNSRDIMSLALYTSEDRAYWICVNNDYLPVKLTYLYDVSNLHDISLFAYITWNQIQQYGFKFALHNEFSDDRFLTVELFVPMHKVGDLNYGFDILVQSDTQLNVYLNYNIIKLTLVNSYDKLDVNTYIKHGLLIHIVNNLLGSDKHIHLLVHNHYNDAMSKLTITLDHFKLPHAVELQVYNSATTSRLEFSYSSDYAEKFTVEVNDILSYKCIIRPPPPDWNSATLAITLRNSPLSYSSDYAEKFTVEVNDILSYKCILRPPPPDWNSATLAITLRNSPLSYSSDYAEKFTVEIYSELIGSKLVSKYLLQHKPSHLLYIFNSELNEYDLNSNFNLQYRNTHNVLNNIGVAYDNASIWLRLNEKPPIQFTYHGLSHLQLSYGALAYTALSHLSARELTVSISESLNGVAFVDFSTVLKLNHTKLLYGKLLYSGRILENLQRHYIHQYNDVNVASTRVLDAFYDLTQTDAVSTLYAVYGSVVGRADEVVNATFEVMKQIVGDCASQNDLVFKLSLPSWNDQPTSILVDTYQTLSAILNQYLRNIFRVFMLDISSVMTFTDDLKALLAAQSVLATVQSKAITLMQYIYDVKDTVQTFAMSVYDLATDFVSMFVEIEEVKFLMGYIVDTYREYFNFQKLHEFISALCQLVVDDIQRNFSELSAYILSLCENKYVHSIRNFFAIVYHKICWGWSYFHVTSRLETELYNRLESYIYLLIFSTPERSISQYGFSLEDRYVEFAQSLPVEWDGFNRLPHYEQLLGKLEKLANSDGTGLMTEVENFKYTLYEQFNTGGLVEDKTLALIVLDQVITYDGLLSPLPNAPGLYVLSYEMRDEKFVLLLEYNQKGEKLLHFWTGGDKLVLNMASGDILLNDQHVELPYELSFNAYIVRIDSSRVKISYEDHLSVLCHMRRDICVIEISPWLHGKTQGLLGNFDHESYNDQAFPNSTLTTNSQSFQQSWTIASPHQSRKSSMEDQEGDHKLRNSSGKASLGDQKAPKGSQVHTQTSFELDWTDEKDPTVQDSLLKSNGSLTLQSLLAKFKTEGEILSGLGGPTFSKSGVQGPTFSKSGSGGPTFGEKSSSMSYDKVDQCEAYFLRSRAPSLCWHRLDSRVFYALCVRSGDPCRAIDAFIAMCREIDAEVKLEPPSHCVQCSINNHHLSQGKSVTLHHSGNSTQHDIVFLVNSYDDLCLSQINMGDILNQLYEHKHPNQSQGKHTPPDLRFGFVLFNNNKYNSDIQMYTSDQNIWHTGVQQGADTLQRMLSDKCTYSSCADVTTTFQALKFLTTLSYRPGATRSIVLLQCSACTDTKGYSDTLAMLLEYNLQFHILSPHAIQSMPSPIIGLDSTGLSYVHKNGQTYTELNKELPASSRLHKDLCSSLALKSHGSLFSLSSPSRETVWPRLVLKAAHTRVCEVCDCVAGDDLMGRLQCDPCATGVDYDLGKVPMDYLDPNEPLDIIM
ncbi:hypothetical protein M8J76_005580 [Diaphorina citri]|nr:hypothetical protein M8J76_005580 [Diaphorina citri]